MGIFFRFQTCLCAGSRVVFLQQKMKSSLSRYRKLQKTLLHSRSQKNVTYAVEMEKSHSRCRKVQKTLLHNKKLRKVSGKICIVCSVILWTLDSIFVHKLAAAEWNLGAYSAEVSAPTSFLEKSQTKRCLVTSRHVSKVQET